MNTLEFDPGLVRFDERGLVPVVTQEAGTGEVLMLAWANEAALRLTLTTGRAHYFSRSRAELWRKGASSGHEQRVLAVRLDCDGDAVLYRVDQTGPACHTGEHSCFHRPLTAATMAPADAAGTSAEGAIAGAALLLERVIAERLRDLPEGSYVARLHDRGVGYVGQKVIEEAGETVVAALTGDDDELAGEAADLLFHLSVLLRERGLGMGPVAEVLLARHRSRSADDG